MPLCTAARAVTWMATKQLQVIQNPLYLPDLMLANFFLFHRVKRELAIRTLIKETLKKELESNSRQLRDLTEKRQSDIMLTLSHG
jgi:hypothetical protein